MPSTVQVSLPVDQATSPAELLSLARWFIARLLARCAAVRPLAAELMNFCISLHTSDAGADGSALQPLQATVVHAPLTCPGLDLVDQCIAVCTDAALPPLHGYAVAAADQGAGRCQVTAGRMSTTLEALFSIGLAAADK